jgi:hypothetical protein
MGWGRVHRCHEVVSSTYSMNVGASAVALGVEEECRH